MTSPSISIRTLRWMAAAALTLPLAAVFSTPAAAAEVGSYTSKSPTQSLNEGVETPPPPAPEPEASQARRRHLRHAEQAQTQAQTPAVAGEQPKPAANANASAPATTARNERLKSIREKLKNDPDVQKARQAVQDAKTPEEKHAAWQHLNEVRNSKLSAEDRELVRTVGAHRDHEHGMRGANLSEADRARLQQIHEKLKGDPELQKAREAVQNAKTEQDKKAARQKLHELRDKKLSPEDRAFMQKLHEGRERGNNGPAPAKQE